jgi:hypothetical protein
MTSDFYEGTAGAAALLLRVASTSGVPAAAYLDRLGVGAAKRSARLAASELRAGRDCGGLFLGPLSTLLAVSEIERDHPTGDLTDGVHTLAGVLADRLKRHGFTFGTMDAGLLGGQTGKLAAFSRLATAPGVADADRRVFLDHVPPAADHVLATCLARMRTAATAQLIGTCLCHGTAALGRLRCLANAEWDDGPTGSAAPNFGSDLGLFTGAFDTWLERAHTGLWPLLGPLAAA